MAILLVILIAQQQSMLVILSGVDGPVLRIISVLLSIFFIIFNVKSLHKVLFVDLLAGNFFSIFMFYAILQIFLSSMFMHSEPLFGALICVLFTVTVCPVIFECRKPLILAVPYIVFAVFIIARLFYVNFDIRYVFLNSQNWVSFYGILLFSPYVFSCFRNNQRVSIILVLTLIGLSVYSHSRSGILASLLLALSTFPFQRRPAYTFAILLGTIVISGYLFSTASHDEYMERFSSINNFFSLTTRSIIISDVLASVEWFNLFLGISYEQIKMTTYITTNLHNSYLNMFLGMGFVGMLLFFIIVVEALIFFLRNNLFYFFVLLAVLLRIFTDSGALFNFFDMAVFFPLWLRHQDKNNLKKQSRGF